MVRPTATQRSSRKGRWSIHGREVPDQVRKFAAKTPFAHLDIAGVVYRSYKAGRYPPNATGWGLLLLTAFAFGLLSK